MSSEKVIAISAEAVECGKRVSDTKKKFIWKFKIASKEYNLQIISSALSGKRVVILNSEEIYSEQNVFNINFDFTHSIQGHSIRIIKGEEAMNSFDLRIDNRSFDYLLRKKKAYEDEMKSEKKNSKYETNESDPFSDFATFANSQPKTQTDFDGFGDFSSFDDFSFKKEEKKVQSKQNPELLQKEEPQTIFTTKSLQNIESDLNNNEDLLSGNFSTNTHSYTQNLVNLMDEGGKEEKGFDFFGKGAEKKKEAVEEPKVKAADFFDSLL